MKEQRKVKVYCTTDHHQHKEKETWPKVGWHVDRKTIAIPERCAYDNHSAHVYTNNGKNKHRVLFERRESDGRILAVTLEVAIEPRAWFGKRHWRGVELTVVLDCPGHAEVVAFEVAEEVES